MVNLIQISEENLQQLVNTCTSIALKTFKDANEQEYQPAEVAKQMLGNCSDTTLWRLSNGKTKVLGTTYVGKTPLYKLQDIKDYLKKNEKPKN